MKQKSKSITSFSSGNSFINKDAAKALQQADNIELYAKLIDLSREALELTEENKQLREEIYRRKTNF